MAASVNQLMAYSAGLVGIILFKTLTPAFYARQDFRTPVRIAIGVVISVQLLNVLLVPQLKVAGLALSIGLGACINAGAMFFLLYRRGIFVPQAGWPAFFAKLAVAVTAMGALAWYASGMFEWTRPHLHGLLRAGTLLLIVSL